MYKVIHFTYTFSGSELTVMDQKSKSLVHGGQLDENVELFFTSWEKGEFHVRDYGENKIASVLMLLHKCTMQSYLECCVHSTYMYTYSNAEAIFDMEKVKSLIETWHLL